MDRLPSWIHSLREEVGGFLESLRARGVPFGYRYAVDGCALAEDLLSTGNVFNDLKVAGLETPEWLAAYGDYLVAFQDPQTGMFYDARLDALIEPGDEDRGAVVTRLRKTLTRAGVSHLLQMGREPARPVTFDEQCRWRTRDEVISELESLPWATDPWGAGSHGAMVPFFLLQRYLQGEEVCGELVVEAVGWLLAQQDPETGLWGARSAPLHARVNGAFKVLTRLSNAWHIVPAYPERLVDSVVRYWRSPDYETVGCNELDNMFLLAVVTRFYPEMRPSLAELVLERIAALEPFRKPDGGFSYHRDRCITHVCECRLVREPIAQSDLMGTGTFCHAIGLGLEMLGLSRPLGWPIRMGEGPPLPAELSQALQERGVRFQVCDRA